MSDHTTALLWQQIQQGNEQAFEQLYRASVLALTNQAYKLVKDEEVTKDILQDVFVSLYLRRKELPASMNVMGYLTNAVKFKVSAHIRDRLNKAPHHLTLLHQQQQEELLPSDPLGGRELQQRIHAGIAGLPDKCRQAFMLSHYYSLSYKAIALEMGISVKTVEKHVSKALQVLRKELQEEQYLLMATGIVSLACLAL